MTFRHRVRTIYVKELIDIMRDRRTLIAMVVVPIVLYPLLMLGSLQAVTYQGESLRQEGFVVGVISESQATLLAGLVNDDTAWLTAETDRLGPDSEEALALPRALTEDLRVRTIPSVDALEQAVRDREIQLLVVFPYDTLVDSPDYENPIDLRADLEELRGRNAWERVRAMIERVGADTIERRLDEYDLPEYFVSPFVVETTDLSTPSSILGEILPLILVLMTITGAIYPAIDLTAGERERGTLESLMVCPVPVIDLIVGKFFVVTTVAIMGATLNLASVAATVYFGGFGELIANTGGPVPIARMALILLSLIPFAVLMSAIMMAVCSYARTFKEAQNYVTPVILAVLVPGGLAAMPGSQLSGVMLVMPVGNMVVLSRELLLGASVPFSGVAMVLLSTTFYAAAAVAIAAHVFGRESVVFSDAGSLKTLLSRRLIRPAELPSVSMALLFTALLFPAWFFIQTALSPSVGESAAGLLRGTSVLMPLMFLVLPACLLAYFKVDIRRTFAIRMPSPRYVVAAVLIGSSAWVLTHELSVLQQPLFGATGVDAEINEMMVEAVTLLGPAMAFFAIAIVPGVCEELVFRGFLLGGLSTASRRWPAILASACVFGIFHFFLSKFAVTAALGIVLGYLCWQSRSILPGMIAHALNNGLGVLFVLRPDAPELLGIVEDGGSAHLPIRVLIGGTVVFVVGCVVASRKDMPQRRISAPIPGGS